MQPGLGRSRAARIGSLLALILFSSTFAFSEAPRERSGRQGGGMMPPGGPVMMGTVLQASGETIEVATRGGENAVFALTRETSCVREVSLDRAQLKAGDAVIVEREPGAERISALRLTTASAEGGGGPPRRHGQGGGPMTGTITGLDPLTVALSSGELKNIDASGPVRYSREEPLSPSEIGKGETVVIISPPARGGERREAKRIIVLPSAYGQVRQKLPERGGTAGSSSKGNEAKEFAGSRFGFREGLLQPDLYAELAVHWAGTGITLASWGDVERVRERYEFSSVDRKIAALYNQGVNVQVELRPANALYGTQFKEFSGSGRGKADEYPEGHVAEYGRFVAAFVERYDGDGGNDAPGSPVVTQYQFIHELPPRHGAFEQYWRANPVKYAELFAVTYTAVKQACPDCDVYFSGSFSEDFEAGTRKAFFAEVFDYFETRKIRFPQLIFDYHYWSRDPGARPADYREHIRIMALIRKFARSYGYADRQVRFVCNTGAPARSPAEEKAQAVFLVKTYALLAGEEVKKLFWAMSRDNKRERDFFAYTGVEYQDGVKKAAYRTLALLMEKMNEADSGGAKRIETRGPEVFVYAFPGRRNGKKLFIAWQDGSSRPTDVAIAGGRGTFAVIDAVTGERITEKKTEGDLIVSLSASPVYVEEQ